MRRVVTANYATAHAVMKARVEVIAAYPITPQTQMVEHIAKFINDGIMDCEYIKVESEHSAISAIVASEAAGVRSFTSTASQGLALMHELLFSAGALRLPLVMAVVNRSVGSTAGIWVEYNDSMPQRDAGWIQMYVETNQEVHDMILQGYKIAEDKRVLLPMMICSDGFILSHTVEPVELAEQEEADRFLPPYAPEHSYLDPKDPMGTGIVTPREYRQEAAYQIHRGMLNAKEVIEEVNRDFADTFGRDHSGLIETEFVDDADVVFLTLGTVTSTTRGVVRELREKGKKVGLVKLRSFRPYPAEEIAEACRDVKAIGVYDRSVSFGVSGPHFLEARNALFELSVPVIDFIGGLGGRDVAEADVRDIYDVLLEAAQTGKARRDVEWVNTRGVEMG
ncbi:MAG: pyruvate ferredoxin oxidoreductase [Thermoplasmata archaeon]